jgi:hypothetical protein
VTSDSRHDELPPALAAELRALGGERAPAALAQRVELARSGGISAPPELWDRVAAELAPEFGRGAARPGRLLRWPRLAAAAGFLALVGGLAYLAMPGRTTAPAEELPVLAAEIPDEVARALRARLVALEVAPSRLSPAAREFTSLLAVPMKEGI